MSAVDPSGQAPIESFLERPLTAAESALAESLDALNDEQIALAGWLSSRHFIETVRHLRLVVPMVKHRNEIRAFINQIDDAMARKAQGGLVARERIALANELGRELRPEETRAVGFAKDLSPAHLNAARELARRDTGSAVFYLGRVAFSTPIAMLERLVSQLDLAVEADEASASRPLVARSALECQLYIELHPCTCGERQRPAERNLISRGDDLVAVYEGPCPRCSEPRLFEFVLDRDIVPVNKIGGATPSQIIDAGQFLFLAEEAARAVPADTSQLDDDARRDARRHMSRAVASLEEVLKFMPPGDDRVPASALFSTAGQQMHADEPGRFRRVRVEAVLAAYRAAIAALAS